MNVRIMVKEDLPILQKWDNDLGFMGEYEPLRQKTRTEIEKTYGSLTGA